jgi:hypothetical protein
MKKIVLLFVLFVTFGCGSHRITIQRDTYDPYYNYWNSPQWFWYDPMWDYRFGPRYYIYAPRRDNHSVRPQPNRPSNRYNNQPRQVVPQQTPSRGNSRNKQR